MCATTTLVNLICMPMYIHYMDEYTYMPIIVFCSVQLIQRKEIGADRMQSYFPDRMYMINSQSLANFDCSSVVCFFFPSRLLPSNSTCFFCLSNSSLLNPDGIRKLLPKWVSSTQWIQQILEKIVCMWCLHLKISFGVCACGSSGRSHSREQWLDQSVQLLLQNCFDQSWMVLE